MVSSISLVQCGHQTEYFKKSDKASKMEEDHQWSTRYSKPRASEATILSRVVINHTKEKNSVKLTSNWKTLILMFLIIFCLTVGVTSIILSNSSSEESKFISTTTLFYNVTLTTVPITSTSESSESCGDQDWISDDKCDDEANKVECQYDGGDCCLSNPIIDYCVKCICHLTGLRNVQDDQEGPGMSHILIGGMDFTDNESNTEVLSVLEYGHTEHQFLASFPGNKIGTFGGLVEDLIIVCGGMKELDNRRGYELWNTVSNECYILNASANAWQLFHVLNTPRTSATSISVNDKLWITGGDPPGYENAPGPMFLPNTEFVDPKHPNVFMEGPDIPYTYIAHHCLVLLNSNEVMLVGGHVDGHWNLPVETFIYDFSLQEWLDGPKIATGRFSFGCARFSDKDKMNWTIISGGIDQNFKGLKSTEMLADSSSEWIPGKKVTMT